MFKNLRKKKKGFTLIELIIVIAIIAILAAVAVPKFGDVRKNAALKADVANAKVIADSTSALLAEGKNLTGTISITIADDGTDGAGKNDIEKYLQNVPKPQTVGYEKYSVLIDANQNVTVSMTDVSNTPAKTKNLYPILQGE